MRETISAEKRVTTRKTRKNDRGFLLKSVVKCIDDQHHFQSSTQSCWTSHSRQNDYGHIGQFLFPMARFPWSLGTSFWDAPQPFVVITIFNHAYVTKYRNVYSCPLIQSSHLHLTGISNDMYFHYYMVVPDKVHLSSAFVQHLLLVIL